MTGCDLAWIKVDSTEYTVSTSWPMVYVCKKQSRDIEKEQIPLLYYGKCKVNNITTYVSSQKAVLPNIHIIQVTGKLCNNGTMNNPFNYHTQLRFTH